VNLKPKVPTKAVCVEHLELRNEILTLLNLQKQLQNKEAEVSANRENSFTEAPSTPKRANRDVDRPFVPDTVGFAGNLEKYILVCFLLASSILSGTTYTFFCFMLPQVREQASGTTSGRFVLSHPLCDDVLNIVSSLMCVCGTSC
jgi:hypothetical protein